MFEIVTKNVAVQVKTKDNGGFGPEYWADRATNHIVSVSNEAPQPIKDQAHAFKDKVRLTTEFYIKQAIKSEKATLASKLREQGHNDIADIISKI